MDNIIKQRYAVDGDDFTLAGANSSKVKKYLKQLGLPQEVIRRVAIAMYEAEINMVIHADGGFIDVEIRVREFPTLKRLCRRGFLLRVTKFVSWALEREWDFRTLKQIQIK